LTRWRTRKNRCIYVGLISVFSLTALAACGVSKTVAAEAVNKAEAAGRRLRENNVPADKSLYYRIHMEQARTALEKRKYAEAREEADVARRAADSLLENREILRERAERELKEMWLLAENDPHPAEAMVRSCFAAQQALENNRLEEALSALQLARKRVGMRVMISSSQTVIIQASDSYYKNKDYIPVYGELDGNRLRGLILKLDKPARARFLRSRWISPGVRYVKVRIEARDADYTGWVEGRFVD